MLNVTVAGDSSRRFAGCHSHTLPGRQFGITEWALMWLAFFGIVGFMALSWFVEKVGRGIGRCP